VDFLLHLADRVQGRRFLHVNSTRDGGGVAEILNRLVPIMRDLGIKAEWSVIEGDSDFYATTKAFHNALQGKEQVFTEAMLEHYIEVNRANAERLRPAGDLVLIHDPQPAAMIEARPSEGKWVWRCHIDLSTPQRRAWTFLRRFVISLRRGRLLAARLRPAAADPPVPRLSVDRPARGQEPADDREGGQENTRAARRPR
jgi:trehalose synthase